VLSRRDHGVVGEKVEYFNKHKVCPMFLKRAFRQTGVNADAVIQGNLFQEAPINPLFPEARIAAVALLTNGLRRKPCARTKKKHLETASSRLG
jgi:hypothetical protein